MPLKIRLVNSEKNFLADYTKKQPIEPIIKECYRQFKIPIPADITKAKLIFIDDVIETPKLYVRLDQTDFNKKFGYYKIPKDAELIFEP